MKSRYGITPAKYASMLKHQQGCCKICAVQFSSEASPCIDHCHDTGKVRGLLCSRCNVGLGYFGDSPDILRRSITYIEGTKMKPTQNTAVLSYMQKRSSITQATASAVLAVSRLAAVILRLKQRGHTINTAYVEGVKGRYAVYTLEK